MSFMEQKQRQTPLHSGSKSPSLNGVRNQNILSSGSTISQSYPKTTVHRMGGQIRKPTPTQQLHQQHPAVSFAPDPYRKDRRAALQRVRDASPNTRLKDMLSTVTRLQDDLKKMPQKAIRHHVKPYMKVDEAANLNFGSQGATTQLSQLPHAYLDDMTETQRMGIQQRAREYLSDYQRIVHDNQMVRENVMEGQLSPESRITESNLGSSFEALQVKRKGKLNRHRICTQQSPSDDSLVYSNTAVCRIQNANQSAQNSIIPSHRSPNNKSQTQSKMSGSGVFRKKQERQGGVRKGLVVFAEHENPVAGNVKKGEEDTISLNRNKSDKINILTYLEEGDNNQTMPARVGGFLGEASLDATSMTHSCHVPVNLDYLSVRQKEDLAGRLLHQLGNMAQGNFDSSFAEPFAVQTNSIQMPYSQKGQDSLATEGSKINKFQNNYQRAKSHTHLIQLPLQEEHARSSNNSGCYPHRNNKREIPMSNVPTQDFGTLAQKSSELQSKTDQNDDNKPLSNCTSYEEFYEFEKMKGEQNGTLEVMDEYDDEEYDSESVEHHEDTQFDEVGSQCRFIRNGQGRMSSRRSKKSAKNKSNTSMQDSRNQHMISSAAPISMENTMTVENVAQSAYIGNGGGVLHSSHIVDDKMNRSYVMAPNPRNYALIPTSSNTKQILEARGKAAINELLSDSLQSAKLIHNCEQAVENNVIELPSLERGFVVDEACKENQNLHEDNSFKLQTTGQNMQQEPSPSPRHSGKSEAKKVVFSQAGEDETHNKQEEKSESFIPERSPIHTINNSPIVRDMNEDQITGNDAANMTNLYIPSQQENKLLGSFLQSPPNISDMNLGPLTPQSAVQERDQQENFGNKKSPINSQQKKIRPLSGKNMPTEFTVPEVPEELSKESYEADKMPEVDLQKNMKREAQSAQGSRPNNEAKPKSILITSKSKHSIQKDQQSGSQKYQQDETSETNKDYKPTILHNESSHTQTIGTLDVVQQPRIMHGEYQYQYQQEVVVAVENKPEPVVNIARKVIKEELGEKYEKPRKSSFEQKCAKTASHHYSGYIKHQDQAESSSSFAAHFPSKQVSPINRQLSNAATETVIINNFDANDHMNVLSEGDAVTDPTQTQIMEHYRPKVMKTPLEIQKQEEKNDIWHGMGRGRTQANAITTTHVSNKDMKGLTNRTSQISQEPLPNSGILKPNNSVMHESNADMKSRNNDKNRGVTFTEKSVQITQGFIKNMDGLVSEITADQEQNMMASTGNLVVNTEIDSPKRLSPPPVKSNKKRYIESPQKDEQPALQFEKEKSVVEEDSVEQISQQSSLKQDPQTLIVQGMSRSDEKCTDSQEHAVHKDCKEVELKSIEELRSEMQEFVEQNQQEGFEQPLVMSSSSQGHIYQSQEITGASKDIKELTNRIQKYWEQQEQQEDSVLGTDERRELQLALEKHRKLRLNSGFQQTQGNYLTPSSRSRQQQLPVLGQQPSTQYLCVSNQDLPHHSVKNAEQFRIRNKSGTDLTQQTQPVKQRRLRSSNTVRENQKIQPQYQIASSFEKRRNISVASNRIRSTMPQPGQVDMLTAIKRRNIKSGANLASQYGRMNHQQEGDEQILLAFSGQQSRPQLRKEYMFAEASSQGSQQERSRSNTRPATHGMGRLLHGQLVSMTPAPYEVLGQAHLQRPLAWAQNQVGLPRHQTPDFIAARSATNAARRTGGMHTQRKVTSDSEPDFREAPSFRPTTSHLQDDYQYHTTTQAPPHFFPQAKTQASSFSLQLQKFKDRTFCQGHSQTTTHAPQDDSSDLHPRTFGTLRQQADDRSSLLMYSRVQNMGVDINTAQKSGTLQQHHQATISTQASQHARVFTKKTGSYAIGMRHKVGSNNSRCDVPLMGRLPVKRARQAQLFV